MKKNNIQIHEFDPVIYPYRLWVCVADDLGPIKERFLTNKEKEIEGDFASFKAMAISAIEREDRHSHGVVIVFKKKEYASNGIIAHECYHATQSLWESIQETYPSEEATAYLLQWFVECCHGLNLKGK